MRLPFVRPCRFAAASLAALLAHGPAAAGEPWRPEAAGEVRWMHRDATSQWSARVARTDGSAPGSALRGEAQWLYRGWDEHQVRLGAQAQRDLLLPPSAGGALIGAMAQDEWSFAPDWRLTFGARGDAAPEADAGASLSPRAALAWQLRPRLSLRLLDGLVWRDASQSLAIDDAPPAPAGLPLASERLRATELALNWQPASMLRLGASLRRQQHSDLAQPAAASGGAPSAGLQYQSLGPSAAGQGLGVEGEWRVDEGWRVRARWATFEERDADDAAAGTMHRLSSVQAAAPLPLAGARLGVEWLWLGRPAGAVTPTQSLVNASLSWSPAASPWSVAASAYNLADHAADDASADGLVREGRRWQLQLARSF